jgi:hypothetical protein
MRIATNLRIVTKRTCAAVLAALTVAATTLIGCSSSGRSSGGMSANGASAGGTSARGRAAGQLPIRASGLASALDLVPEMPDGYAMYTDWSMLGHQDGNSADTASFAGALLAGDDQLQRDLGIRSTYAQWELDVTRAGRPPLVVLGFGRHTDLSGLAGRLTRLGYHADGSIFTGPASYSPGRIWAIALRNIGIDSRRHLLVGGRDPAAVRSVLAGPARPLGHASAVIPLLALASARLGRIATASTAVGSVACVGLTALIGLRATPEAVAVVRKRLPGTFTPPQAEITALPSPTAKTALDAMTFPGHGTARANQRSRLAASKVLTGLALGDPAEARVTSTAVTGRVLRFNLTAGQPRDFPQLVLNNDLGVDICP